MILLECKITNKLVPFNCVSLSLRTLFIMKQTKVLNNKTQDQLHISALNIYRGWSVGVGNTHTHSMKIMATEIMAIRWPRIDGFTLLETHLKLHFLDVLWGNPWVFFIRREKERKVRATGADRSSAGRDKTSEGKPWMLKTKKRGCELLSYDAERVGGIVWNASIHANKSQRADLHAVFSLF